MNHQQDDPLNCPNFLLIHHPLSTHVQSLYFANVAYDITDDALRQRWTQENGWGSKNQSLEREGPKMAEVYRHKLLKV